MSTKVKISPSILSANFAQLGKEVKYIDEAGADYIHIDVMDGHFVPNLTFGPVIIKSIRKYTNKPFDTHLMINDPDKYIKDYAQAGSDIITIHAEATNHLDRSIELIKETGKKAGVSIVPSTNPDILDYIINKIDLILVMTVNPGFGGQTFIDSQLEKIKTISKKIKNSKRQIDLSVDGGINKENVHKIIKSGANIIVAGSAIFSGGKEQYSKNINNLRK